MKAFIFSIFVQNRDWNRKCIAFHFIPYCTKSFHFIISIWWVNFCIFFLVGNLSSRWVWFINNICNQFLYIQSKCMLLIKVFEYKFCIRYDHNIIIMIRTHIFHIINNEITYYMSIEMKSNYNNNRNKKKRN